MENLHSIIRELRTHLQDAYDYNIKETDSRPYQMAEAAGINKLKEMGFKPGVLYLTKEDFEFFLEKDPELNTQRIK